MYVSLLMFMHVEYIYIYIYIYIYVITFTNDDSRYGYVYLMHKKFDALDKVKEFKAKSEKQLHKT